MTHNEKRAHWIIEGLIGTGTGILFGVTVVATAHVTLIKLFKRNLNKNLKNPIKPFDTIKTKMQAQVGFEKEGMVNTIIKTIKNDGIKGLYR